MGTRGRKPVVCSFCDRTEAADTKAIVQRVTGPRRYVAICDVCLILCIGTLVDAAHGGPKLPRTV